MFLKYKNTAFTHYSFSFLSIRSEAAGKRRVPGEAQNDGYYAPDIAPCPRQDTNVIHHWPHTAGMAHLLASAVLAGFSTVRHLSPVVADEETIFRSPSSLRLTRARAHLVRRFSPILGFVLVEQLGYIR